MNIVRFGDYEITVFVDPLLPDGELHLIPPRRKRESENAWRRRCVRMVNIGTGPPLVKLGPGGDYVSEWPAQENSDG